MSRLGSDQLCAVLTDFGVAAFGQRNFLAVFRGDFLILHCSVPATDGKDGSIVDFFSREIKQEIKTDEFGQVEFL